MDKKDAAVIVVLLILIIFLSANLADRQRKLKEFKKQAIENNAARYVVDSEGNVAFEWLTK